MPALLVYLASLLTAAAAESHGLHLLAIVGALAALTLACKAELRWLAERLPALDLNPRTDP